MPENPNKYSAGGEESPSLYDSELGTNHDTLSLAGYEMDSVSEIDMFHNPKSIENYVPKVLMSWLQLIATLPDSYGNGEFRYDVKWRKFIGNVGGSTPAHADFARHFLAFLHHVLKDENDLRLAIGILDVSTSKCDWQEREKNGDLHLYAASFVYIAGLRRLAVTEKGYVELSARSVQTGGKIFVFPGGLVPFVLRAFREDNYRLFKEVYVLDIMRDEALTYSS